MSVDALQWVDGVVYASRWTRPLNAEPDEEEDVEDEGADGDESSEDGQLRDRHGHDREQTITSETEWVTPLTSKPSLRSKGRSASKDPTMQKA